MPPIHLFSDLLLYLKVCGQAWAVIYIIWTFLTTSWAVHFMVIGFFICICSYFRLSPPSMPLVKKVLGSSPHEDDNGDVVWELAHRAACLDAPENSLEAITTAATKGAKWIEVDVSFTSDGTAVAFHDDTLERVTDGTGPINSITFTQLNKLDLAPKHPLSANFQSVRIPTIEDFVALCMKLKLKVILDLKTWDIPEETTNVVTELYKKMPELKTNCLITSFYPTLLYKLRLTNPDIICAVSTRPHYFASSQYDGTDEILRPRYTGLQHYGASFIDLIYPWLLNNVLWWFVGISAVLVNKNMISRQFIVDWRRKNVQVFAWTVNSPLEKATMKHLMGVQVLTDTLDGLPSERWLPQL